MLERLHENDKATMTFGEKANKAKAGREPLV